MRTASLILTSLGTSIAASLTASAQDQKISGKPTEKGAGNDFAITGYGRLNADDKRKDEEQLRRQLDVLKEQKKQITTKIQQKEKCGGAC